MLKVLNKVNALPESLTRPNWSEVPGLLPDAVDGGIGVDGGRPVRGSADV